MTNSPEYRTWRGMINRCENPNATGFERYGGRGVEICERWRKSFEAFYEDMGPRPTRLHTLDRVRKTGNYEPGNCRWATKREQSNNRTDNRMVTIYGSEMTLTDACRLFGSVIDYKQAWKRVLAGWPHERAVQTPPTR